MNKIIIHISDLHVSLHLNEDGVKEKTNFWLNTDVTDVNNNFFISNFCLFLKKEYADFEKYLIISGDICNKAIQGEFDSAENYLKEIIKELQIDIANILIIPGDHDVNWSDCNSAYENSRLINSTKKAYEYQDEKLSKFSVFYKNILNKDFIPSKNIVDKLIFEDSKIIFIGMNSNNLIQKGGGEGAFNIETFKTELDEIENCYKDYSKIAVMHHNLFAQYEPSHKGQWNQGNRTFTLSVLQSLNYKCVLYGNEHTYSSKFHDEYKLYALDSGSFTSKEKPKPSFFVFTIDNFTDKVNLNLQLFVCDHNHRNNKYPFGSWVRQSIEDYGDKNIIELESKSTEKKEIQDILPSSELIEVEKLKIVPKLKTKKKYYKSSNFSTQLYDTIKEKKLFHSGHFHWSKTSRAHNWIDVSKILENNEHLLLAKKSIVDVIEKCELTNKFDFVIGLGTEGNIISTRTVIKYNKPYSFLPYSYRYDEHNEFEQKLNFVNNGLYKNVLIITDVVNDGRTIRKLIGKREELFFKEVENIYVISLFYTGDEKEIHSGILNHSNIKKFDSENDEIINNIEFYSVLNIKVEKCPYGKEYESECLIYKDGLDCVHLFYDEKKDA